MIRYFFISLLILVLAVCLQQWYYGLNRFVWEVPVLITPLVFLCVAAAQRYPVALVLAFMVGMAWDADHSLAPFRFNTELDISTPDNLRYGYSIFLFGVAGFFVKFFQALIPFRGVLVHTVIVLFTLFGYLVSEAVLFCFVRGSFPADFLIFWYLGKVALVSILPAPLVLYGMGYCWRLLKTDEPGFAVGMRSLWQGAVGKHY